jgi:hypothetical protein
MRFLGSGGCFLGNFGVYFTVFGGFLIKFGCFWQAWREKKNNKEHKMSSKWLKTHQISSNFYILPQKTPQNAIKIP